MKSRLTIGIALALAGLCLDAAPAEAQIVLDRRSRTAWYLPAAGGKAQPGGIGAAVTRNSKSFRRAPWEAPWSGPRGSVRRAQMLPPPPHGAAPTDLPPGLRRSIVASPGGVFNPQRGPWRRRPRPR